MNATVRRGAVVVLLGAFRDMRGFGTYLAIWNETFADAHTA